VRLGTSADLDDLLSIENRAFSCDRITRHGFSRFVLSPRTILMVQEQPSRCVGYVLLLFHPAGRIARIYSLAVDPLVRGAGVGCRLLSAAVRAAQVRQAAVLRLEVSDGNEQYPTAPAAIHLYVDDPDATYARTLQAGATSFYAPTDDHPSGDRWGAVKDPFGNHWYIAKPRGWTPRPEGLRSVQPYLHLREAHKMIPFLEAVFGAEATGVHKSPQGAVLHATIRIGNATLEIDEAHGEFQPMPCHLHVYVPDTDAVYARAMAAGTTSIEAPRNAPYGDRAAGVKDAWGNSWFIATYLGQ